MFELQPTKYKQLNDIIKKLEYNNLGIEKIVEEILNAELSGNEEKIFDIIEANNITPMDERFWAIDDVLSTYLMS